MRRRSALLPALAACALLVVSGAAAEAAPRKLPADGRWVGFEVKVPGEKAAFLFAVRSGIRYRLTVEPTTLERAVVDLSVGAGAPQRFGSPERGKPAVHEWDPEGEGVGRADVGGFSALVGTARIRLETIGPDGKVQTKARPWLGVTGEHARVGDLALGETERWDLAVEPGRSYEVEPTRGSAVGVLLRVLAGDGSELAASTRPWLPFDPVRFRVPPASPGPAAGGPPGPPGPAGTAPAAPALPAVEVRGLRGSGGTYGLRLTPLPDGEPLVPPPSTPPPPVERGVVPGEALTFRANAGDVAILSTPAASGVRLASGMQEQVGGAWVDLPPDAPLTTMMSQEHDHLAWFRPERAGTYRFRLFQREPGAPAAGAPVPLVVAGDGLGGAPVLIGIPGDPAVRARPTASWQTIGLAVVTPAFPYLFVAAEASDAIGMRVTDLAGKVLVARAPNSDTPTVAAGLGPTLRFRAKQVGLLRLEVKGPGTRTYAMLRRAAN